MNVTLPLTPGEEERLHKTAHAEGVSLEMLLRRATDPMLLSVLPVVSSQQSNGPRLSFNEADRALEELLDTLPVMPSLSDHALSRKSIYERDDEVR